MKRVTLCMLVLLISTVTDAVRISSTDTGEVLIFPYYTVNNNFNTLINLTNTTDQAKALRVRFREAANAREVFTFNLYLGPNDAWVGAVVKGIVQKEESTKLITNDSSCTVPLINDSSSSVSEAFFNNSHYTGDMQDVYGESNHRMLEGFIEVIEMGVLSGESADAVTIPSDGSGPDCMRLVDAWSANADDNYWLQDSSIDVSAPSGGLIGNIVLINVIEGLSINEKATALNDFSEEIMHFSADNNAPNLTDADPVSTVKQQGQTYESQWSTGFEAVSSVLMAKSLNAEYALDEEISAKTDWLITFPTSQYHTDPLFVQGDYAIGPFVEMSDQEPSCAKYYIYNVFNRDGERLIDSIGIPPPGSPPPPRPPDEELCYAANVVNISRGDGFNGEQTPVLGSRFFPQVNITTPYRNGWAQMKFDNLSIANNDVVFSGLPVIGFAAQQYTNSNAQPGLLAQYMGQFELNKQTEVRMTGDDQKRLNKPMSIASNNQGQVLLYPYYNVRNGLNSIITVVNTSDKVRALKATFREGLNAREVLNFNIYLDAYDVWTAGLVASNSTVPGYEGQQSVKILSFDSSCLVPFINGQEFLPYAFTGNFNDGLLQDLSRATEGSVEIIDMGIVTGDDADAASHVFGQPQDCLQLVGNWTAPIGQWIVNPQVNMEPSSDASGLMGTMSLIDVANGTDMSYNAIAIENFTTEVSHSFPGNLEPNLASGNNSITVIESSEGAFEITWDSPVQAVTALFMQAKISNEYAIDESINAETEWVNFFPTKRYYVDPLVAEFLFPAAPFTEAVGNNGACEDHRFKSYNREQQINLSPVPPPPAVGYPKNCWSVVVADVNKGDNDSSIFDSQLPVMNLNLDGYASFSNLTYENGWMQIDLIDDLVEPGHLTGVGKNGEIHTIYGLPVIGFTAQKYVNGNAQPDLLANYGVINMNKGKRKIMVTTSEEIDQ